MPETIPENVRAFLRAHVESYEQLELLLLLRARADGIWTLDEIARHVGGSDEELGGALSRLRDAGVIERTPPGDAVRYAPRDAAQRAAIDGVAAAYEEKPLAVIKLMNANAIERVRTAAIDTFADSFVVGRRKDG